MPDKDEQKPEEKKEEKPAPKNNLVITQQGLFPETNFLRGAGSL